MAAVKKNKINHFAGSAGGPFIFAATHRAYAVAGECFNLAVVIGREVASILLGCVVL